MTHFQMLQCLLCGLRSKSGKDADMSTVHAERISTEVAASPLETAQKKVLSVPGRWTRCLRTLA